MRGVMLFGAGLLTGLAVHVAMAQSANNGVVMMNHVAVAVPNMAEAMTHYTQKMGYREAFRALDANGQPRLVYLHISRNTFLELQPANAQRPAGFNHYGLHVEDVAAAVARLPAGRPDRQRRQHQRHWGDPGQHHRPLHGPHRAGAAATGLDASEGDRELEMRRRARFAVVALALLPAAVVLGQQRGGTP